MNDLSVTEPRQRRRRFSREFREGVVAKCLEHGASASRIALDNGVNANMVRRWIREARWAPKTPATTPGFVPVSDAVHKATSLRWLFLTFSFLHPTKPPTL